MFKCVGLWGIFFSFKSPQRGKAVALREAVGVAVNKATDRIIVRRRGQSFR